MKNQIDVLRSLVNLWSFAQWIFLDHGTLLRSEERVEAIPFFLSGDGRQLDGISMKILTPKGVFIGFPNRLKWFKPFKGLGHLI